MEEKVLKIDVEQNGEEIISRGYEDEGDILVKTISDNSSICIDKETGIILDVTNDGVSCEGLSEIVELNNAGLIKKESVDREVIDDAKSGEIDE